MELPVEALLKAKNIHYRLIALTEDAYTVEDVMKYTKEKVNAREICKTIVLRGKKSGKKIGFLLRGGDKVDFSAMKKICGEEMAIASPEEVKEAAGVEPGAVCPFLLSAPLLVDEKVMNLMTINCGSGDHLCGLEFEIQDLIKAVEYEIVKASKVPAVER
jgi:prolyl-tRNA editing enzyme YbaK/EbsC (Cys-tRNA(Pro) deacylase)